MDTVYVERCYLGFRAWVLSEWREWRLGTFSDVAATRRRYPKRKGFKVIDIT